MKIMNALNVVFAAGGLIVAGAAVVDIATADSTGYPESPCSPTSGYACTSPTTTTPLTPEGACVVIGLDTELADPTFIDPREDRVVGFTLFVQYNPQSASTAICPLRLNQSQAEDLYDLLDSMLAEGIEPE
jgi:hypothetical protein